VSAQKSVPLTGASAAAAVEGALDRLVTTPPAVLGGRKVTSVTDYRKGDPTRPRWFDTAPLVELFVEGGRVLVRPSGTEPKLKVYVDLSSNVDAAGAAGPLEETLSASAQRAALDLVTALGTLGDDERRGQGAT
jgi:phosphomannomutase